MTLQVTVYIDFRSPFAYLAKDEARALAGEFGAALEWLPFAIDLEGAYGGEVEERSERDWQKVRYLYMDARRLANRRGLIIRGPKKIFDPTLAHIGMLYAKLAGIFRAYHDIVLERFWRRELDIEDAAAMQAVIAEIGGSAVDFERYRAGAGPEDYAAILKTAKERGVFGVPTFIFADELFWGTDRMWLLRERLTASLAPQPPG